MTPESLTQWFPCMAPQSFFHEIEIEAVFKNRALKWVRIMKNYGSQQSCVTVTLMTV